MFDLPEGKIIEIEDIKTNYEVGSEEECDEIAFMYNCIVKLIEDSDDSNIDNKLMKITLKSHVSMIENRSDLTKCQKTVRRKRIISMWHNTQVLKQSKDKN